MNYKIKQLIIIFIGVAFMNCSTADKKSEVESTQRELEQSEDGNSVIISKKQFENENLSFGQLIESPFPTVIKATGMIDVPPNNRAIISAHIGGYLKNSPLLIGDQVKKGQLLFSIENIEFLEMQQEYLETYEQLEYLKAEYERHTAMYEEKISSKKAFLKAKNDYNKTQIKYQSIKEKLEFLNINPKMVESGELSSISKMYAPIGGSITELKGSTGSYLSPADEIMEIVNTDHIHLELKIFEKDALAIKKGQTVYFSLPESSLDKHLGEVHLIGKSIGKDRTIAIHVHIEEDPSNRFFPGMFVQADILLDTKQNMALPENAVIELNDKNFALLLESEDEDQFTLIKKELIIGESYDNQVLIKNHSSLDPSGKYLLGSYNLIGQE